jgi:ABC-type transport system substrate-binding protein
MVFVASCQSLNTTGNVNFTAQRIAATNCNYGGILSSVEAIDADTVRFTLCSPDPSFPSKLANPAFAIMDQDYLNSTQGATKTISLQPVGTGPYVLDLFTTDTLTLKANPMYWGIPAKSSTVNFKWNEDPFKRYSALESKIADVINNPDPKFYSSVKANSNYQLQTIPTYSLYYFGFNNTVAPFDNPKVRQAIAQFIDRAALVINNFPEGSTVAEQLVPSTLSPGFTSNMKWYPRDAQKALQTMDAEYKDRSKVVNFYYEAPEPGVYPNSSALAFYISSHFKNDLNISNKLIPLDKDTFENNLKEGKLDCFLAKFDAYYPDATGFYDYMFIQNGAAFGKLDPNLISEINAAKKSASSIIRQGHYDIVNQLIRDQVPLIPIGFVGGAVANNISIENVIAGPFNLNLPEMSSPNNTVTLMQSAQPYSLNPMDESDTDTFRVTGLIYDTLVTYGYGGVALQPSLADSWSSNSDLTKWTFTLHYGVKFSNGAALDANDIVATFSALWDYNSPNHIGRTGTFKVLKEVFGNFLNAPSQ